MNITMTTAIATSQRHCTLAEQFIEIIATELRRRGESLDTDTMGDVLCGLGLQAEFDEYWQLVATPRDPPKRNAKQERPE